MNDFRHPALLKEKLEGLGLASRFRQYALTFAEAEYKWGGESMTGTDCSGIFCGPLQFLGYKIRTTADVLYNKAFDDVSMLFSKDDVNAIFFLNDDGVASHMGLFLSDSVVLHASGKRGVTFDTIEDIMDEYDEKGMTPVIQVLDWGKLEELDGEESGLDEDYL